MKKILLVDNHKNIITLLETTLSIFDLEFIRTDNGSDAIKLAKANIPDIILLDIKMPGKINGFQVLKHIKKNIKTTNCKVILLTSISGDKDIKKGLSFGASGYLKNPFHPVELISLIESLL